MDRKIREWTFSGTNYGNPKEGPCHYLKINARLLAVMLLGAVDYAAYYLMRGKISGNPGEILEQALEMVLHGILRK